MSARATFLVLVLFSTLGQALFDGQQKRVSLTCQSELKAIPCKDSGIPSWTTDMQADTVPHSLISRTSSHTHVPGSCINDINCNAQGLRHKQIVGIQPW